MDFALLILLSAVYVIRPSDWIPGLASIPVFQLTIVPCLLVSMGAWTKKLSGQSLRESPITVCVLGILAIAFASQLVNAPGEIVKTINLAKGCVFYLLIVSIVDTRARFLAYLKWLAVISFLLGLSMILASRGAIGDAEKALAHYGSRIGAFEGKAFDPNDSAALLVPGILLCGHFVITLPGIVRRIFWAALGGATAYSFLLTESRGGLLGLAVGMFAYIWLRWGIKGLAWGLLLLPPLAVRFATERMVDVDAVAEGTGQQRVQMWHSGFVLFKQNALLGIGPDRFTDVVGKASHNSFLQPFAELGFFGGALFVGAFYLSGMAIYRIVRRSKIEMPEHDDVDPTPAVIFAMVMGYAAAIFTLNHVYTGFTYLVLAVASCCETEYAHYADREIDPARLMKQVVIAGVGFLVFIYVAANTLVNW